MTTTESTWDAHSQQREEMLRAAEHRVQEHPAPDIRQLQHIHDLKQQFRRLIEPGIMRHNNNENALLALKTLETLSSNLLREPENEKFQRFKPTNNAIKKRLVDVMGALEYAVAMGFHHKVENFQPLYVFNDRHLEELRIGNEILKETLTREAEKAARASHSKLPSVKEQQEIARQRVSFRFQNSSHRGTFLTPLLLAFPKPVKIQLQFHEDRLEKQERDKREAELRAAREAAGEVAPPTPTTASTSRIPTGGMTLSGHVEHTAEGPTRRVPYEDDDEDE
ncbi:hypothetical protein A7U60_g3234 [Sanghuangporus baumii]|uniref:PUB domain-containing protein n=1 Tax=Sanghuangporus baumii TaxID=108892 RepID=A0A9Q5I1H9_SANBA|nr:hypothetical protein A7U60_g3234 [Sanghuangporus baumii]